MAKIWIKGEDQPKFVNDSEARKILDLKNKAAADPKLKAQLVSIGDDNLPISKIKSVSFEHAVARSQYDLKNPNDRAQIRMFELEMDQYKTNAKMAHNLGFYGEVVDDEKGKVWNDMLKLCHWSEVQYCMEKIVLSRIAHGDMIYWAIVAERTNSYDEDSPVNCTKYLDYKAKREALQDLRSKRAFVQQAESGF